MIKPTIELIQASAEDAANIHMRKNGRKVWNEEDYNVAVKTQARLIRSTQVLGNVSNLIADNMEK